MKIAKAAFFDRSSTNNIALSITAAKLLSLFCKKIERVIFFNLEKKIIETTNNSGAL